MAEPFDPYYTWLGIPPEEQPANHYRLLGLKDFESNPDAISHAMDRQMAHLRTLQAGKHASHSQSLLNVVAAAGSCLLNQTEKSAYDQKLRELQRKAVVPRTAIAKALPVAKAFAPERTPITVPIADTNQTAAISPTEPTKPEADVARPAAAPKVNVTPSKTAKENPAVFVIAAVCLSVVALVSGFIVWRLQGGMNNEQDAKPTLAEAKTTPQIQSAVASSQTKPKATNREGPKVEPKKTIETAKPVETSKPAEPMGESSTLLTPPSTEVVGPTPAEPARLAEPAEQTNVAPPQEVAATPEAPHSAAENNKAGQASSLTPEDLAKARNAILEVFGPAAKQAANTEQKIKLAQEMLKLASDTKDDAAAEYVLTDNARKLLVGAGDVQGALVTVEKLEKTFTALSREARTATLNAFADDTLKPDARETLVAAILQAINQAIQERNFTLAEQYSLLAMKTATKSKDPDLRKRVTQRRAEVAKLKLQAAAFETASSMLREMPDDPKANLIVGKFLCFHLQDFAAGRLHLIKGDDEELANAARLDVAADTADATAQTASGDSWWKWSDSAKGSDKDGVVAARSRAESQYRQAVSSLKGLEKVRVEKRLTEASMAAVAIVPTPPTKPAAKKEGPVLVLYNTHNRTFGDRGTLKFNLILTRNGKTVEEFLEQPFEWSRTENAQKKIQLGDKLFDKIRIEITEWQTGGGGLTEVELLVNGKNQLLGRPVKASGVFDNHKVLFNPSMIVDGVTTEANAPVGQGFWLLPDRSAGWIEVSVN